MNKGKLNMIRPFSFNHEENPDKKGTDHRYFSSAFLVDDNGKKFPYSWGFEGWTNHPVYRIVKVVAEGKWNDDKTKEYFNKGCPYLEDITSNKFGNFPVNKYEQGWRGSRVLLMNVIDRLDSWCKDNKHTKVMVKDASYNTEYENWNTSYGFPSSVYTEMLKKANDKYSSIADVDFAVVRLDKPESVGNTDIYYKVFMPEFDPQLLERFPNPSLDYEKLFKKDVMTDEEASYEAYNFDEMQLYKPSSVKYFLSKKAKFVKGVDEKYGTHFFEELRELAEQEKALWKEQNSQEESSTQEANEQPKEESPTQETHSRRPLEVSEPEHEVKEENSALDEIIKQAPTFTSINDLSDIELEFVTGVDKDGLLTYDCLPQDLEPCIKCSTSFPANFNTCPKCGQKYK